MTEEWGQRNREAEVTNSGRVTRWVSVILPARFWHSFPCPIPLPPSPDSGSTNSVRLKIGDHFERSCTAFVRHRRSLRFSCPLRHGPENRSAGAHACGCRCARARVLARAYAYARAPACARENVLFFIQNTGDFQTDTSFQNLRDEWDAERRAWGARAPRVPCRAPRAAHRASTGIRNALGRRVYSARARNTAREARALPQPRHPAFSALIPSLPISERSYEPLPAKKAGGKRTDLAGTGGRWRGGNCKLQIGNWELQIADLRAPGSGLQLGAVQ